MLRSRKEKRQYDRHQASTRKRACEFCEFSKSSNQQIKETKHFRIIRNIFGYSQWDSCKVTDHLMLVPKHHVGAVAAMGQNAQREYVKLISDFEKRGYNIYIRGVGSSIKSVPHHHTHCIKTDNRRRRFLLYLKKPYLRWTN